MTDHNKTGPALFLGCVVLVVCVAVAFPPGNTQRSITPDQVWVSTLEPDSIKGPIAQRDPSRLGSRRVGGRVEWLGEWGGQWFFIPEYEWIEYRGLLACVPEGYEYQRGEEQ